MKIILVIFILFSFNCLPQGVSRMIGVSNCSCDSISVDSIVTLIRSYHPNGKVAVDTAVFISNKCKIEDLSITEYDSIGRITKYQKANYSWARSYDSNGLIINETIYFPTETVNRKFILLKRGDKLVTMTVFHNDTKESVTQYIGRKATTKYLNYKRIQILKYNKAKKITLHIEKEKVPNGKKYYTRIKNTYNSNDLILKSIRMENGKQTEIVKMYYEDERKNKEVRYNLTDNSTITTNYYYQ